MSAAPLASEAERPVAVAIRNVDKWFGNFQALKQIDLDVHKGEKIVICGPSGSGKSTLIRCINRLEKHDSGRIVVNDKHRGFILHRSSPVWQWEV